MELTMMSWILFGVGFVPWRVGWTAQRRRHGRQWRQGRTLTVEAIFWQLTVQQHSQSSAWELNVPLIARCKSAVWAVLQSLTKG